MNNGEGAMKKETCDQQRHGNKRKRMEDDGGKFERELNKSN